MGPEEVLAGSLGAGDPGPGKRKTDLTLGERQLLLPQFLFISQPCCFLSSFDSVLAN